MLRAFDGRPDALAVIAYPAIDPVLVRIGPFAVRWYGLAYVAGFLGAGFLIYWLAKRWKLRMSVDDVVLDPALRDRRRDRRRAARLRAHLRGGAVLGGPGEGLRDLGRRHVVPRGLVGHPARRLVRRAFAEDAVPAVCDLGASARRSASCSDGSATS